MCLIKEMSAQKARSFVRRCLLKWWPYTKILSIVMQQGITSHCSLNYEMKIVKIPKYCFSTNFCTPIFNSIFGIISASSIFSPVYMETLKLINHVLSCRLAQTYMSERLFSRGSLLCSSANIPADLI